MITIYRITDVPSTNPSPIHQDNKPLLNKICLDSFLKYNKPTKVIFLADHCGQGTINMIRDTVKCDFEIQQSNIGINDTYIKQMHIARDLDDDILFQECDYFYVSDGIEEAIKEFGFVSPYDHLDKYPGEGKLRLFNGRHCDPSQTIHYFDCLFPGVILVPYVA